MELVGGTPSDFDDLGVVDFLDESLGDDALFGDFAGVVGAFCGVFDVTEDEEALIFAPMIFFGCGDASLFLLCIA
jgi:hypothetical protein